MRQRFTTSYVFSSKLVLSLSLQVTIIAFFLIFLKDLFSKGQSILKYPYLLHSKQVGGSFSLSFFFFLLGSPIEKDFFLKFGLLFFIKCLNFLVIRTSSSSLFSSSEISLFSSILTANWGLWSSSSWCLPLYFVLWSAHTSLGNQKAFQATRC